MNVPESSCVGARDHRPRFAEIDRHHIFPNYLADLLGVARQPLTAALCSGCHDSLHHVLRHLINEGTWGGHRPAPGLRGLIEAARDWWQKEMR